MARFYSDYLPLSGADETGIGQTPPVVRVEIEVPQGFAEQYYWIDASTEHRETRAPIDQLKDALVARYREAALGVIARYRQARRLGLAQVISQTVELEGGVSLQYVSQQGQELITLRIPEPVAVKVSEEGEASLHMLVLYSGNKIAAFKMSDLEKSNAVGSAVYKKTLANSSWPATGYSCFSQCAPMEGVQTLMSAFHFNLSEKTISAGNKMRFCKSDFSYSYETNVVKESIPIQVLATGATKTSAKIYTNCDVFNIAGTNITRSEPPTGWGDGHAEPVYIMPNGDYICDAVLASFTYNSYSDDAFLDWVDEGEDGPWAGKPEGGDSYWQAMQYYAGFHVGGGKFYQRDYRVITAPSWNVTSTVSYPLVSEKEAATKVSKLTSITLDYSIHEYPNHFEFFGFEIWSSAPTDQTKVFFKTEVIDTVDGQWLQKRSGWELGTWREDHSWSSYTTGQIFHNRSGTITPPEPGTDLGDTWVYKVAAEGGGPPYYLYAFNHDPEFIIAKFSPQTTTGGASIEKIEYLGIMPWPFAYDGKPFFYISKWRVGTNDTDYYFYDPFGGMQTTDVDYTPIPWFHLSTGKVVMQGTMAFRFETNDYKHHRIFCNGTNITESLRTALGLSDLKSVAAIFLDIKLSDIKKFT